MKRTLVALSVLALCTLASTKASAFCGFYVSGADAELYNNATMVSLMREGKRTVLSMQNNYEGPPEDFAMVVPVPVVLNKKDVKTLPEGLFGSLDALTAPRLVEYWERDPCYKPPRRRYKPKNASKSFGIDSPLGAMGGSSQPPKVKVEAEFKVGEYDIVVLSSTESTALEDWLNQNNYNIPDGAAPYFKPYVQKGQYFFVAKVNIDKVQYKDGEAILSPIRFHYDAEDFVLPVRLGLINSKGAQDLIAFILAKRQRYKVANFPNVTIPTNIPVKPATKNSFASFYSELFDNVLKENPQAVVTEYSWNAATCDPCPKPPLKPDELMSLGADVLPSTQKNSGGRYRSPWQATGRNWVITRLHTRYGKHTLGEDLVFEAAPGIRGGRGMPQGAQGKLGEQAAEPSPTNQFQGRYVIRHFWNGEIGCENPRRGVWGGPGGKGSPETGAANNLAFSGRARRNGLATYVDDQEDIPGLKQPVDTYNVPAGDVIESWGKLVEPPSLQEIDDGAGAPEPEERDSPEETDEEDSIEKTDEQISTDKVNVPSDGQKDSDANPTERASSKAEDDKSGGCATGSSGSAAAVLLILFGATIRRRLIID
jgi:hypothetical protein